ncbi:PREDICTED: protein dopey-1-like [Priapulus caudatus]|uniref:Protein dopey-1-like n=1 Tax=Priapulus caudatus TaxID=37621 RepID=A0ABM1E4W3_PRICU|nr:PREDICTED: protein dopey-1-like [Priapulus caudatus]
MVTPSHLYAFVLFTTRSICDALQDANILVQRLLLDFLVLAFPLHSSHLVRDDVVRIISAAMYVLLRRDMSLNRRLYTWMLGVDSTGHPVNFGDGGATTPIRRQMSDASDAGALYFDAFSRELLVCGVRRALARHEGAPAASARPLRVLIALLDRPEIGSAILDDVLLDVVRYVRRHATGGRHRRDDEVAKTANLLFGSLEPSFVWEYVARAFEATARPEDAGEVSGGRPEVAGGRGIAVATVEELCALVDFLLDVYTLETYAETQTWHLPALLRRVTVVVTTRCGAFTERELTACLRLCSKILAKVAPSLVSDEKLSTPAKQYRRSESAEAPPGGRTTAQRTGESDSEYASCDDTAAAQADGIHGDKANGFRGDDKDRIRSDDTTNGVNVNDKHGRIHGDDATNSIHGDVVTNGIHGDGIRDDDELDLDSRGAPNVGWKTVCDSSASVTMTTAITNSPMPNCLVSTQNEGGALAWPGEKPASVKRTPSGGVAVATGDVADAPRTLMRACVDTYLEFFTTFAVQRLLVGPDILATSITMVEARGRGRAAAAAAEEDEEEEEEEEYVWMTERQRGMSGVFALACQLLLEFSCFPMYCREHVLLPRADLQNEMAAASLPSWLQVLLVFSCFVDHFPLQSCAISTLLELISLCRSIHDQHLAVRRPLAPHGGSPDTVTVLIVPILSECHLGYIDSKTDFYKIVAENLWEALDSSNQICHQRAVELLQQVHNLAPSAMICEDVIGHCLISSDQDLFIYSAGLFPLLGHAAINVRPALLNIYEAHFVPLGKEISRIYLDSRFQMGRDIRKRVNGAEEVPDGTNPRLQFSSFLWDGSGRNRIKGQALRPSLPGLLLGIFPGLEEGSDYYDRCTFVVLDKLHDGTGPLRSAAEAWTNQALSHGDAPRLLAPLLLLLLHPDTARISLQRTPVAPAGKMITDCWDDSGDHEAKIYAISSVDGNVMYHVAKPPPLPPAPPTGRSSSAPSLASYVSDDPVFPVQGEPPSKDRHLVGDIPSTLTSSDVAPDGGAPRGRSATIAGVGSKMAPPLQPRAASCCDVSSPAATGDDDAASSTGSSGDSGKAGSAAGGAFTDSGEHGETRFLTEAEHPDSAEAAHAIARSIIDEILLRVVPDDDPAPTPDPPPGGDDGQVHPAHVHLLVYRGTYDAARCLHSLSSLRALICANPRLAVCALATTGANDQRLLVALTRHRHADDYYATAAPPGGGPTADDVAANRRVRLAASEVLHLVAAELVTLTRDAGRAFACYIADTLAKCGARETVLRLVAACVHDARLDGGAPADAADGLAESYLASLLKVTASLVKLEAQIDAWRTDAAAENERKSEARVAAATIAGQQLFLSAVLGGLRQQHNSHLHRYWVAVVMATLPYLGASLPSVVTPTVNQVCRNLELLSHLYAGRAHLIRFIAHLTSGANEIVQDLSRIRRLVVVHETDTEGSTGRAELATGCAVFEHAEMAEGRDCVEQHECVGAQVEAVKRYARLWHLTSEMHTKTKSRYLAVEDFPRAEVLLLRYLLCLKVEDFLPLVRAAWLRNVTPLEVSLLQFFYAYVQRVSAAQLLDSWPSLLSLLRDGLHIDLVAPGKFLLLMKTWKIPALSSRYLTPSLSPLSLWYRGNSGRSRMIINEFVQKVPMFEDRKDQKDLQVERLAECLRIAQVPSIQAQVFLCFRHPPAAQCRHSNSSLWPTIITECDVHVFLQVEQELSTDTEEFKRGNRQHLKNLGALDSSWTVLSGNGLNAHNNPQWLHLYLSVCKLLDLALVLPSDVQPQFQMLRLVCPQRTMTFVGEQTTERKYQKTPEFEPHCLRIAHLLNSKVQKLSEARSRAPAAPRPHAPDAHLRLHDLQVSSTHLPNVDQSASAYHRDASLSETLPGAPIARSGAAAAQFR